MDGMVLDLKHAVRSIAAGPRFAAMVIVTLALGIGANTAVFSVLNRVVLKPLPYEDLERLVRVYHSSGDDNSYLTGLAAADYRDHSRTLEVAVLYTYSVQGADLTDRRATRSGQSAGDRPHSWPPAFCRFARLGGR
jgi:hypothetical protein